MAGKGLVNLTTGMEDPEQVTLAFLVAGAALEQGKEVVIWTTKEAVRLGLPGTAQGEACDGRPPLERLFQQFHDGGGKLWLCPSGATARKLAEEEMVHSVTIVGAPPMWQRAGDDTIVYSY